MPQTIYVINDYAPYNMEAVEIHELVYNILTEHIGYVEFVVSFKQIYKWGNDSAIVDIMRSNDGYFFVNINRCFFSIEEAKEKQDRLLKEDLIKGIIK